MLLLHIILLITFPITLLLFGGAEELSEVARIFIPISMIGGILITIKRLNKISFNLDRIEAIIILSAILFTSLMGLCFAVLSNGLVGLGVGVFLCSMGFSLLLRPKHFED